MRLDSASSVHSAPLIAAANEARRPERWIAESCALRTGIAVLTAARVTMDDADAVFVAAAVQEAESRWRRAGAVVVVVDDVAAVDGHHSKSTRPADAAAVSTEPLHDEVNDTDDDAEDVAVCLMTEARGGFPGCEPRSKTGRKMEVAAAHCAEGWATAEQLGLA
jgi:hypothetical protein